MNKSDIIQQIQSRRAGAIIRTSDRQLAHDAISAAVAGGFRMVEFTLTTPDALDLIREFAGNDKLLVGAGTVLTPEDADRAVDAGARFLVSPITDAAVIERAARLGVVSIPGAFTPSEMMTAHRYGADLVKIFPSPGDVATYVASVLGPLPHLRLYPTAGVTPRNMIDVLRAGATGVGFVKSLFEPEDLAVADFDAIERRAAMIIERLGQVNER
jgi:2-dehydro-3-deoxyphosphogluconate aldolase/(4S)-4-hydroxy-2-oxoglutarate aldolase